ncbi:MAG: adenosylcobinamide-GDP ribazoletransferase, partial [Vicinamibacteria bacterium]
MTRLLAAVAFLSRFPVRRKFESSDLGRAAVFFPLVGAAIGLLQWGAFRLLTPRFSSFAVAVALVALSAWITRAIHLDGLADFADGLGGGWTRENALRIMRDPSIGAFGAVTLVLTLAAKVAAIDSLKSEGALVLAPALARWASVPLGFLLPCAREGEGLGAAFSAGAGRMELVGATAMAIAISLFFPPRLSVLLWG